MERKCGLVDRICFSSSRSGHGICVIEFQDKYAASKALGMSKRRTPFCCPELNVNWGPLEIFRGERIHLHSTSSRSPRVTISQSDFPSFSSAAEIAAPSGASSDTVGHDSKDESFSIPASLPDSEPSPKSTEALTAELKALNAKHNNALLSNDALLMCLDRVLQEVRNIRDAINSQEDIATAAALSIEQTKAQADNLKAQIDTTEKDLSILATVLEDTEKDVAKEIENKRTLENEIVKARIRNTSLEDLVAKADERGRAIWNMRLHVLADQMKPLPVEDTFMSDAMLSAFWKYHQIITNTTEEMREETRTDAT